MAFYIIGAGLDLSCVLFSVAMCLRNVIGPESNRRLTMERKSWFYV